jgi:thiamine-monophosphate kinase
MRFGLSQERLSFQFWTRPALHSQTVQVEDSLLDIIQEVCRDRISVPSTVVPMGDDAAVFKVRPGGQLVFCSDAVVEGVHFHQGLYSPVSIGRRAVIACLSDLAAMGANPISVCISVAPPRISWPDTQEWVRQFYRGVDQALGQVGAALAGGDLVRPGVNGACFADVSAIGLIPEGGRAILRSTARPGQTVAVSGAPGRAASARRILELAQPRPDDPWALCCWPQQLRAEQENAFLAPCARFDLIETVQRSAQALIDISDGLAADARRLAEASAVDILLDLDRLSEFVDQHITLDDVLNGGDDHHLLGAFELVPAEFVAIGSVVPRRVPEMSRVWSMRKGLKQPEELAESGFDHFRRLTEEGSE